MSVLTWLGGGCASGRKNSASLLEMERKIGALHSENQRLVSKINRLENSLIVLQDRIDVLEGALKSAENTSVVHSKTKISRGSMSRDLPPPPAKAKAEKFLSNEKSAYDAAFSLFKSGKYDEALVAFENFIKEYKHSDLCDNAAYWMGEIFYSQGEYELALQEFERVIKNYPDGNKVPDALLKLGMTYEKLGRIDRSRRVFEEVVRKFGSTRAAVLARARLDSWSSEEKTNNTEDRGHL